LNRGIALNDSATWGDPSTYYKDSGNNPDHIWNHYAEYMHQIGIGHKAYAMPYDDRNDQASYVSLAAPTQVNVTLGSWGSLRQNAALAGALSRMTPNLGASGAAEEFTPRSKVVPTDLDPDALHTSRQVQGKEGPTGTVPTSPPASTEALDAYF